MSDFGLRHYSAILGRWINRDPIGDLGGANVYAYVANNPTNRVDYLGLAIALCTGPNCGGDWPPHTENGGQWENDKKPCPKRPEGKKKPEEDRNKEPDWVAQVRRGVHPQDFIDCHNFCAGAGYEGDDYFACRSGCVAGMRREPSPCPESSTASSKACADGYRRGIADRTPNNPNASTNGCSAPFFGNTPGGKSGFDFTSACDNHDRCYGTIGKSRKECDEEFLEDMLRQCFARSSPSHLRQSCIRWAQRYYVAVRLFGAPFYNAAQGEASGVTRSRPPTHPKR